MTQQTAQGLASLGRGPDSMLVHMAPGEVKSLQQLAMAHGGSLTINPETGLPEAGFLSKILPMVLGAGAMMIPGVGPLMAAGLVGGGYAAATGSMKKGLMAGLGAYGGAGLASGLTAAGAASGAGAAGAGMPELLGNAGAELAAQPATFAGNLAQAGQGFTALPTSEAARTAFMGNAASKGVEAAGVGGLKGLGMAGLSALAPMMDTTTKQPEIKSDANMGQRYQFNAGTQTPTAAPDVPGYENQGQNFGKEQWYFNPSYEQIDNEAARKMYGFASGGPVEAMSNANAIGMNTGYPQADIDTGAYATPYQQPISRDMIQPQFAGGGSINLQGTFDTGGGQGGSQAGNSNNPQPFIGNNNAPSMMPQAQVMPSSNGFSGMPGGLQDLLKNMAGFSFAGGGSIDTNAPQNGLFKNLLPPGGMQSGISNAAVGGYSFDPATQKYTQNASGAGDSSADPSSNGLIGRLLAQADMQGGSSGYAYNPTTQKFAAKEGSDATPAMAQGGISNLGDYSDGGRLLRGPGDGISDSIPAMIGKKQPARLADGEFVVPARIVSELGNGSTEAGARKLYAMMDRVQKARGKTVGKGKVAANSRAEKHLPA